MILPLDLAASCMTGRRSDQLNYALESIVSVKIEHP